MQVRLFQIELLFQCKVLLAADDDLGHSISERNRLMLRSQEPAVRAMRENTSLQMADTDRKTWMALQQLLGAAANISRLLWSGDAQGAAEQREASRAGLRTVVGADAFVALKPRALRNQWEHIDEYIEAWWSTTARHVFVHRNIGGPPATGLAKAEQFLHFDMATKTVTFWGEVAHVPALVDETRALRLHLEAILGTELSPYV
jgi:hypothetical protein